MPDLPTSIQYRLGVDIGRLVVQAMRDGATYSEVIATLDHCKNLAVRNEAFGIDFTADKAVTD